MPRAPFRLIAAFALGLMVFAQPAAAQSSAPAAEPVTLTPRHVENFITLTPLLRDLAQRYGDDDKNNTGNNVLTAIARSQRALADLNALLRQHDFNDAAEWGAVASNIALAYNWISEGDGPELALKSQMDVIREDTVLDDMQKAQIMEALEGQLAVFDAIRPPQGNLDLVARYRERIAAALKE